MNILSINTSTKQYSLAVLRDEALLAEYILTPGSDHFRHLMPSLDDLLTKAGLRAQMLDGLVVAIGPGSFTGIRVGLSVVKGLSECLKLPVIGVSTLSAMASQLPYVKEDVCPLVTSRKTEVFTALFRWTSDGVLSRITQDTFLRISELRSIIKKETVFIGNDLVKQGPSLREHLGEKALLAPAHLWNLKASSVGILGLGRLKGGQADNIDELVPRYFRGADIRLPSMKSG